MRLPKTVRLYGKRYPLAWDGDRWTAEATVVDVAPTDDLVFMRLRLTHYPGSGRALAQWVAALTFTREANVGFTNCRAEATTMTAAVTAVVGRMRMRAAMLRDVSVALHGEDD